MARLNPAAITTAPSQEPFTLQPLIRRMLSTRRCISGSIFIVEGIDVVPVPAATPEDDDSHAIRLVLGDGELCIQALLHPDMFYLVEKRDVFVGCCVREEDAREERERGGEKGMVYLIVNELETAGWNESYMAMWRRHEKGKDAVDAGDAEQPAVVTDKTPTKARFQDKGKAQTPRPLDDNDENDDDEDDEDLENAFEAFEARTFPVRKATPKKPAASNARETAAASDKSQQQPIALPKDWHDHQTPLKLTTLRLIPHLPYAQNWSVNVLAIVASLSPVEPSHLAPGKQRTARIADPSTAKQVHLTVFLDPDGFTPRVGSAVLLVGVKNHRFDGGSLKKYASDGGDGDRRWWFEDPWDLSWLDVAGIKSWWQGQLKLKQPKHRFVVPSFKPRRRRESLDAFLDSLSPWDLLYIRNRFRDGHIKMEGFAGLRELPPEVFASIVPHLRLQDVLNCFLVSKDWREAWTQGVVSTFLCRRFFPGLLELYGGDVPDRHDLFLASAKRYLRKHFISRSKRSFVSWDVGWSSDYFISSQEAPPGRQLGDLRKVDFGFAPLTICYSNGKVAWQPDNCHLFVDDLYTRERARFSFGVDFVSGRPLQLQAVTDSLVILASSSPQYRDRNVPDNGQTITVFHLENRLSKNVVLPGKFAQCYAQGDVVAFVTKQGHVIIWGWSDTAYELEIDHGEHFHQPNGWEKDLGGVPGIMFHPTDTDIVFAGWLNSPAPPDPRIHTIVVIKFDRGVPVARFETSLSHPEYRRHPDSRHSCPAMRLTLSCHKMNDYGGYAIGIVQFVLLKEGAPWEEDDDKKNPEWLCICFNVLTESFAQNKYESRRRPYPPTVKHFDLCVWEDQFIIAWFDEYLVSRHYSYGMQWLVPSPANEGGCSRISEVDDATRRHRSDIAGYMFEIGFARRIFVDNDFLLITTGQGYMLLTCNDEIDLPGIITTGGDGVPDFSKNPPWPIQGERIEPPRLLGSWDTRKVTSLERISGNTDET
ncbi:hypothetical protein V8C34DRAFT_315336 [Trichoderma compactum]